MECVEFLLYNYWVLSWYKLLSGYAAYLYCLLPIGRIAWYKLSSGYAAHLYSLLPIDRISWYKLSSSYAAYLYSSLPIDRISWYKLLSSYAAHLHSLLPIDRIAWYKLLSSYAAHLHSLLSIDRIAWYKLLSSYAAYLSPWKGEKERGLLIPNWRFKLVTNRNFYPFQETGCNFARVPTKSFNLLLARKNARILHQRILLIINYLHSYK